MQNGSVWDENSCMQVHTRARKQIYMSAHVYEAGDSDRCQLRAICGDCRESRLLTGRAPHLPGPWRRSARGRRVGELPRRRGATHRPRAKGVPPVQVCRYGHRRIGVPGGTPEEWFPLRGPLEPAIPWGEQAHARRTPKPREEAAHRLRVPYYVSKGPPVAVSDDLRQCRTASAACRSVQQHAAARDRMKRHALACGGTPRRAKACGGMQWPAPACHGEQRPATCASKGGPKHARAYISRQHSQ